MNILESKMDILLSVVTTLVNLFCVPQALG